MVYYMNHTLPVKEHFWRPVPAGFKPRDADSEKMWFKIGDTVYVTWSNQFEQAVLWDKLKHD